MTDDRDHGNHHLAPVWPQVAKQPAHQPAVVGLSEDVFFVHYDAASSSSSNCFR